MSSGYIHHEKDANQQDFWLLSYLGTPQEIQSLVAHCKQIPDVYENYRSVAKMRQQAVEQVIEVITYNPNSAIILKLAYHR